MFISEVFHFNLLFLVLAILAGSNKFLILIKLIKLIELVCFI